MRPSPLFLVLGLALLAAGMVGVHFGVNLLWAGLAVAVVLLGLHIRAPWPLTIDLIDVWLLAFILLFLPEATQAARGAAAHFGINLATQAGSFIAGAFGATLVGYWLILGKAQTKRPRRWSGTRPTRSPGRRPPLFVVLYVSSLHVVAFYYAFVYLGPSRLFGGRSYRFLNADYGPLDTVGVLTLVLVPVVCAYVFRRYRLRMIIRITLAAASMLSLLALAAIGTRFYLGFAAVGVLYFLLDKLYLLARRRVFLLAGVFIVLFSLQGVLLLTRTAGFSKILREGDISELLAPKKEFSLQAEGLLSVTSLILEYPAVWARGWPGENLFLLYWWVPRFVWPAKPVMAGHWLIREYGYARGFGEGHSVSGGFSMPALVDFGPTWGMLFCLFYGGLLGGFERYVRARRLENWTSASLLAAFLYFGVFFMMRSLQTSLIFLMEVFLAGVLPVATAEMLSRTGLRKQMHAR